jgi:hypothetical protein
MSSDARDRRLLAAYEAGRLRHALVAASPLIALAVPPVCVGTRPLVTLALVALLYVAGVLCAWRGRELGRGMFAGALAGVLPLGLALVAQSMGHACTPAGCVSWCVPACTAGGVGAGAFIAWCAARRRAPFAFWGAAAGTSALTGALGCACAGYGGVLGLAIGLAVSLMLGRGLLAVRVAR